MEELDGFRLNEGLWTLRMQISEPIKLGGVGGCSLENEEVVAGAIRPGYLQHPEETS